MAKTKKTAKGLAKEYYPTYWSAERMVNLVKNEKVDFTEDDYNKITGLVYPAIE